MDAKTYKDEGNKAFQQKRYEDSIKSYSSAIDLAPNDHVLYSNRSGSYASIKDYENALKDAEKCVSIKPDWAKGYQRLGFAHFYLNKYDEAKAAYEKGLEIDPTNVQLQDGKKRVEEVLSNPAGGEGEEEGGMGGLGSLLNSEIGMKVFQGLLSNPETAGYINDPVFVKNLAACAKNPMLFLTLGQQDPRLSRAFELITGNKFDFANPKAPNSDEIFKKKPEEEKKSAPPAPPAAPAEPLDEADQVKNEGNAFYKKKDFEKALECYEKAITLQPQEILYYNNKAAVFIEQNQYTEALGELDRALKVIEETESGIKFESKAKVYARKGTIHFKLDQLQEAQIWLNKSIIENNDQKVRDELKQIDKIIKDKKSKEYINPALAEEANNRAKEHFQAGHFPEALKEYEEATKRNPDEPQYYFNIGMCRIKLLDWHNALREFEYCINKDPKYAQVYPKKGNVHMVLKEYNKAIDMYTIGLKLDPSNYECQQGLSKADQYILYGAPDETEEDKQRRVEHAAKDPEIQEIMRIPQVMNALQSISSPADAQQIMTDPFLGPQVKKLIMAGIVSVK